MAGVKVLIVEDEELVRMVAADMLSDLGFDILESGTAEEALEILGTEAIDVMFTDYGLPTDNGAVLARRALDLQPTLKIIFASGFHLTEEFIGCDLLERCRQVEKPYGLDALQHVFENICSGAGQTSELRKP